MYFKNNVKYLMITMILMVIISGCSYKNTSANKQVEIIKKDNWTEVGENIFVFTSEFYFANMTLITSGNEGILIDTGMNEEDKNNIEAFIKKRNIEIKNIIITHMHDDHIGNLNKLKTDEILLITPNNAKNNQILNFNNKTIKIFYTEGHFKGNEHISVEVLEDNILIAGDIICNNILPPIASGGNIDNLLSTLKEIQIKNYNVIIPGHGEIVDSDLVIKRQLEYLNNVNKYVMETINNNGRISDLTKIKLEDCMSDTSYLKEENLELWHLRTLQAIYVQLKKKL